MPELPDRSELVRLTTILDALVTEVRNLSLKVEELKDDHIFDVEHRLAVLEERVSSTGAKLTKIEDSFSWVLRVIVAEGIALVAGIIMWMVEKYV